MYKLEENVLQHGKLGSHEQKDCTVPKSFYLLAAKFPSGRIKKFVDKAPSSFLRGIKKKTRKYVGRRRDLGGRSRMEYNYRKIPEINTAEGKLLNIYF